MQEYTIAIRKSEEDKGYTAMIPELPSCSAFGKTEEEALKEIKIAIALRLKVKQTGKKKQRKTEGNFKIAMVMLTFNRLEFTKIVIDNYFKTTRVPHKLLVWDNFSSDGSREWLDRVAKKRYPLRVHLSRRNIGVPEAIRGFLAHPSYQGMDLVGKIDNDILVENGWLEGFVEAFEKVPKLGMVAGYNEHNPPRSFRKINGVMLNPAKYGILGSVWLARRSIFDKYPFTERGYAGPWNYFRTLGTKHNVFLAYHKDARFKTDCRQWGGKSPFPDIDYKKYYAQVARYRGGPKVVPK